MHSKLRDISKKKKRILRFSNAESKKWAIVSPEAVQGRHHCSQFFFLYDIPAIAFEWEDIKNLINLSNSD